MTTDEVPPAVRKIVEAQVAHVLARCEHEGIAWNDFYESMLQEQASHPHTSPSDLFERTFRRLAARSN